MTGCIYRLPDGRCDKPGKYMAFCIGEACSSQTPSNYDLLISKTPEEMADWMCRTQFRSGDFCPPKHGWKYCQMADGCRECWLGWLKDPGRGAAALLSGER